MPTIAKERFSIQGVFLPSTRSLNQIPRNSDRTLFLPQLEGPTNHPQKNGHLSSVRANMKSLSASSWEISTSGHRRGNGATLRVPQDRAVVGFRRYSGGRFERAASTQITGGFDCSGGGRRRQGEAPDRMRLRLAFSAIVLVLVIVLVLDLDLDLCSGGLKGRGDRTVRLRRRAVRRGRSFYLI